MGREGFEPSTGGLKVRCSTAELPTRFDAFKTYVRNARRTVFAHDIFWCGPTSACCFMSARQNQVVLLVPPPAHNAAAHFQSFHVVRSSVVYLSSHGKTRAEEVSLTPGSRWIP